RVMSTPDAAAAALLAPVAIEALRRNCRTSKSVCASMLLAWACKALAFTSAAVTWLMVLMAVPPRFISGPSAAAASAMVTPPSFLRICRAPGQPQARQFVLVVHSEDLWQANVPILV